MAICNTQTKLFVKALREQNPPVTYPEIEEMVYQAGHRDVNGKRINNAALSAETIADFPQLRVRQPNRKKRKSKVGRPKGSVNKKKNTSSISAQIKLMRSLGLGEVQIVRILEATK